MNREVLLAALFTCKPCISNQTVIPILTHFCFDKNKIFAFNGAQAIVVNCETDLECAIPGDLLYKLVNSFSQSEVKFQQKDDEIIVKSGKSFMKLATLPKNDFVFEDPEEGYASFDINADFIKGIKKCLLSVNDNPINQNQFGITLCSSGGTSHLYSTDTGRISRYILEKSLGDMDTILLPKAFCEMLISIADKTSNGVINIGEDFLVAHFDNVLLFSKIQNDIDFLDFEGVISDCYKEDSINPQKIPTNFSQILDRCLIITSSEFDQIISIRGDETIMEINTNSPKGFIREEIELEKALVGIYDFKMDAKFLRQALDHVSEITFTQTDDKSVLFAGTDGQFLHLILSF